MFRQTLALAIPAALLGIGLAQMTPQDRVALFQRLGAAPSPTATSVAGPPPRGPEPVVRNDRLAWSTTVEPDSLGQFKTTVEVSGHLLPVLVDTGASFVALSYEDAAAVGIHPRDADFKYAVQTANGTTRAAGAVISRMRVGNVEVTDVQAIVSQPGALTGHSLLGMSFLRKLSGFGVESGRLVLRQ